MNIKILFDERGLRPGDKYIKGQWEEISSHNENEIKGFFGEYSFLNNFYKVVIIFDEDKYPSVENAYQAAKYKKEKRTYFMTCSPKEAILFGRNHLMDNYTIEKWNIIKYNIMQNLLLQKFDAQLNYDNFSKLKLTEKKYLEETNYWEDTYWGIHKTSLNDSGVGDNNLGNLLMKIRLINTNLNN